MEARSSKRTRISYAMVDRYYEKKLNIDISANEKEFDDCSYASSCPYASSYPRTKKRALPTTALPDNAKRHKRCNKDENCEIDRNLGKDPKPLSAVKKREERKQSEVLSVILKTAELHHALFETTEKKAFTQDHSIMKAIPPQVLSAIEPGNRKKPIYHDTARQAAETRNRLDMTVSSNPQTPLHAARRYQKSLLEAAIVAQKVKKVASSKLHSSKLNTLTRWWKTVFFIMSIAMIVHAIYTKQPFEKDCIYVNGGGFGGFWFILGQLYKLHEENEAHNYVCYSAGCLGAASILANRTFEDLFDSALNIQTNWKEGSISRFDAVELFVDDLLGSSEQLDVSAFSNLHILTSVPKIDGWEVHQNIAGDMEHLKTLLVQTAWIPFITGDHIWHAAGHMDGGFSRLQHPTCNTHISLPWDWNLLVNTMNINMGKEEGNRYWELGLNYDI